MTTIASNLREMAGDTRVSWEGVGTDNYSSVKVFSINKCLYGIRGEDCIGQGLALEWLADGAIPANRPVPPKGADWQILELSKTGLAIYTTHLDRDLILNEFICIGSGRKVAMYCMKVLGMSPAEAVHEACKADDWSDSPIYVASLADGVVRRWKPKKGRK